VNPEVERYIEKGEKTSINLSLRDGSLVISRTSSSDPDVLQEIRDNKDHIRYELIKKKYNLSWPPYGEATTEEGQIRGLDELMGEEMDREGYVLFWSDLYSDPIALHRDDVEADSVPIDFVPYSETEMAMMNLLAPETSKWGRIHKAKKKFRGAQVTQAPPMKML
jgi:hypothetical protein